jgi:hypothetical protein
MIKILKSNSDSVRREIRKHLRIHVKKVIEYPSTSQDLTLALEIH